MSKFYQFLERGPTTNCWSFTVRPSGRTSVPSQTLR